MNGQRQQGRLRDCELVIVSWASRSGTIKQIGNIENLSSGGMAVLIDCPIPMGASITISYGGEDQLAGVVKHVSRYSDRHLIGIEFTGASKESTLHFQPEFLIQN